MFPSVPLLKGVGEAVAADGKMIYKRLKWKRKWIFFDVWVLQLLLPEIEGIHC